MATPESIGIAREAVMARLRVVAARLSDALGVEWPVELRSNRNEPAQTLVWHLEDLADFLEQVDSKVSQQQKDKTDETGSKKGK